MEKIELWVLSESQKYYCAAVVPDGSTYNAFVIFKAFKSRGWAVKVIQNDKDITQLLSACDEVTLKKCDVR